MHWLLFMELVPFAAMVVAECMDVGLTTLSKAAMSKGMSHFVFVLYSNALSSLILLPCFLLFNRRNSQRLTLSLLSKFFFLSLVGITALQNCVFTGVKYSSPTLASAMVNLVPAFTFLLAALFRMEKLDLRAWRGRIKIIATLVSISGAMVVTFYKGPMLIGPSTNQPQPEPSPSSLLTVNSWIIGGFLLATSSLCLALSNIGQAAILKGYPSKITLVTFYCFFGTVQCTVVSLIAEKNMNAWVLHSGIEVIAIIYSAVCGNVVTFGVLAYCISVKGPVFVAMFKPLGIAIAAFFGFLFLGDSLHLGSIVGAVIIVAGFYGVIWTQFKDMNDDSHSSGSQTPLLTGKDNTHPSLI